MYFTRNIEEIIKKDLNKGKIFIIYGVGEVGKTTMLKQGLPQSEMLWLACDEGRIQAKITPDSLALRELFGGAKLVVFDEMQTIENPGRVLKLIADHLPDTTAIATGSSAFDLANKVSEPLTGRFFSYVLYPLAFSELTRNTPRTDLGFFMDQCLLFGSYPGVVTAVSREEKIRKLELLSDSYLYKDILEFDLVKDSATIRNLLVALALQIGSEVSYQELATKIGMTYKTVQRYIDLLEKSFVIFRLRAFAGNKRNELTRKVKIYFYDCGIRNVLINNFNPLSLRSDGGALFENFIVAERMKRESWQPQRTNRYFWRTYDQHEIDLIEEQNGRITATEIKLSRPSREIKPKKFFADYPDATFQLMSKDQPLTVSDWLQ